MKKYNILINTFLVVTFSVLLGTRCFSQISYDLYNILPSSFKPQNRNNINTSEANKILRHPFPNPNWTAKMYTNQICYKLNNYTFREDQFDNLHTICYYLYFATDYNENVVRRAKKLNSFFSKEARTGIESYDIFIKNFSNETKIPNVYMHNAHFLMKLEKYVEVYYALEKYMQLSKQKNLSENVSGVHTSMASLVGNLGLEHLEIIHLDSALVVIKGKVIKRSCESEHHIDDRQLSFLSKYEKNTKKTWSDSVFNLHAHIKSPNNRFNVSVEEKPHVTLTELLYAQKKYTHALSRIDSALSLLPDMKQRDLWNNAMDHIALSLIKLRKEKSENALLQDINFSKIDNLVIVEVFEELSKHEAKEGNLQKAIDYQKRLLDYRKMKSLLYLQGKSIDIEKRYQLNQWEQTIFDLQQTQEDNMTISIFVIVLAYFLLAILFFRYKINNLNTKMVLKQIGIMRVLNIMQIEEARELERKRLAQDLHDDFSASIAASINYLHIISKHNNMKDNRQQTSKVLLMLKDSYDRARQKSQNMYWEEHEDIFWKNTLDHISILFSGTNIKLEIDNSIIGVKLSVEIKKTILLVLKESIINIIKHADATEVVILLYDEFNYLKLEISDNGKGFKEKSSKRSLGIMSLKERMKTLGGQFQIIANVPKGTSVICIFPINTDNESIILS